MPHGKHAIHFAPNWEARTEFCTLAEVVAREAAHLCAGSETGHGWEWELALERAGYSGHVLEYWERSPEPDWDALP